LKKKKILLSGLIALMCCAVSAFGEAKDPNSNKISVELTSSLAGKYIWRGQNLSDDPVFQPGLNIGYGKLTAGLWGNMDLSNINGNSGDMSEIDYSLDYSDNFGCLEWLGYSVGAIYYDFPGTAIGDTTEIYGGLSLDIPLSPSVKLYHDVDEADGSYVSLAVGHSIEKIADIGPGLLPIGLDLGASLGWASGSYDKYYWGTDQSKMQDLTFVASFPTEIIGFDVAMNLNYVMLVSDDIRDMDTYGTASDFFFVSLSLTKSF